MRLSVIALVMLLLGSAAVNTAKAADWESFWGNFHLVKQRNQAWPQPFLHNDQQTYYAMINPMIERGWQVEATLDSVHFDQETNRLNRAGIAKLANILQTAPADNRMVFVTNQHDADTTMQRINAIEAQLSKWSMQEELQVAKTNVRPSPQTGVFVETSYKNFQQSMPIPALQKLNVGNITSGN